MAKIKVKWSITGGSVTIPLKMNFDCQKVLSDDSIQKLQRGISLIGCDNNVITYQNKTGATTSLETIDTTKIDTILRYLKFDI
ncbi:MAG: hypothetical protein AAB456_00285 [Patescibacteria group bacterium]